MLDETDIDELPMGEELDDDDYDDLDEYSLSKFASMYFQGAATASHVRQRLRQPLLFHEDGGDVQVLLEQRNPAAPHRNLLDVLLTLLCLLRPRSTSGGSSSGSWATSRSPGSRCWGTRGRDGASRRSHSETQDCLLIQGF